MCLFPVLPTAVEGRVGDFFIIILFVSITYAWTVTGFEMKTSSGVAPGDIFPAVVLWLTYHLLFSNEW